MSLIITQRLICFRDIFIEALTEEINFRLLELATKFHEACNSLPSGPQQGIFSYNISRFTMYCLTLMRCIAVKYACRHGPAQYFTVKKDGKNKGIYVHFSCHTARCAINLSIVPCVAALLSLL